MPERDLETLFLAFRERGDVAGLAAVFDRTSDELLTIALHLVPEPAQADDVVQATFLTAIQRAETFDESRALMPWLVGILANQAARARQLRAQSIDPSKIETRVQPDPSDELERAEVSRILARAVEDLPEPYRAAVKRHVIDGERAIDIARQSGIAAGTVRMHILRGLERLRRALPAGLFAGGAWSVPEADTTRSIVLEAARAKARILAASATTSATAGISATVWSIGGLLMSIKILLGAGALVVAALFLWNLAPAPATGLVASSSTSPDESTKLATTPPSVEQSRQVSIIASNSVAAASARTSGWWLKGTVSGLGGKAADQTKVIAHRVPYAAVTANCDKTGEFELDVGALFEGSPPTDLIVSADHPANRHGAAMVRISSSDVERGRSERVELTCEVELAPFALIKGRVETASDVAHGTIGLELRPADGHFVWPPREFPTRPDPKTGCFTMAVREGGSKRIYAACDGLLSFWCPVEVVLGETVDVGLIRLEAGSAVIEGRVAVPFTLGPGVLRVLARRSDDVGQPGGYGPKSHLEGLAQYADIDASGRFRITGITPGAWQLTLRPKDSSVQVLDTAVECTAPSSGVSIGANLGRLVVVATTKNTPRRVMALVNKADRRGDTSARTNENGQATFFVEMGIDVELEVWPPGFDPVLLSISAAARTVDMIQPVELPDRGHGALVLVPGDLAPPALLVRAYENNPGVNRGPQRVLRYEAKLVDGKYLLPDMEAGHWCIVASPTEPHWEGGGTFWTEETLVLDIVAGETTEERVTFHEAGRVRFEIDGWSGDMDSQNLANASIVDTSGLGLRLVFVVTKMQNWSLTAVPDVTLAPKPGTQPVGAVFADSPGMERSYQIFLDATNYLEQGLSPGDYRITIDGRDWISLPVPFHVDAGATTNVRIPVRKR